jgi:hypothetical protein
MSGNDSPEDAGNMEGDVDSLQVTTIWEVVREYRARILQRFFYLDESTRDALALAVSELAENIVKYGAHGPGRGPTIAVRVTPSRIFVRSENLMRSDEEAQLAIETVARLAEELHENTDATAVYASRIEQTLAEGGQHSRQGFYRIAAVAGFTLRAAIDGKTLTISCERAR